MTAKENGDQAFVDFLTKRFSGDRTMKFFDILPKIKLNSFSTRKSKKIVAKEKEIMLKADKNLFGMMTILSQSRNLGIKKFCLIYWIQYLGHLQLVMAHCVKQTKLSWATILKKKTFNTFWRNSWKFVIYKRCNESCSKNQRKTENI